MCFCTDFGKISCIKNQCNWNDTSMIPEWYLNGTSLIPQRHPKKYEKRKEERLCGILGKVIYKT